MRFVFLWDAAGAFFLDDVLLATDFLVVEEGPWLFALLFLDR